MKRMLSVVVHAVVALFAAISAVCREVKNGLVRFLATRTAGAMLIIGIGILASCASAVAQSTNMPDATGIYTGLSTPFNAALTWTIAATTVLTVIGWILVAVRRRR